MVFSAIKSERDDSRHSQNVILLLQLLVETATVCEINYTYNLRTVHGTFKTSTSMFQNCGSHLFLGSHFCNTWYVIIFSNLRIRKYTHSSSYVVTLTDCQFLKKILNYRVTSRYATPSFTPSNAQWFLKVPLYFVF